jgi:hypothetical protein
MRDTLSQRFKRRAEKPETKTPKTEGHETHPTNSPDRRRFINRGGRLATLLATGVLGLIPNVAHGQEYPSADSNYTTGSAPQSLQSPRLIVNNFLLGALQTDPTIQRILDNPKNVDIITETYVDTISPQTVNRVSFSIDKDKVNGSLTDRDTESGVVVASPVNSPGEVPQVHRQLIDNDNFLSNQRTVQVFKVRSFMDWKNSKKRIPISEAVTLPEWEETAINANPNSIEQVPNPTTDIVSPLLHKSDFTVELNQKISKSQRAKGLVAALVIEKWKERDSTTGYRRGQRDSFYPLSTAKKSIFRKNSTKKLFMSYRERWKHLHILESAPKNATQTSYSRRLSNR